MEIKAWPHLIDFPTFIDDYQRPFSADTAPSLEGCAWFADGIIRAGDDDFRALRKYCVNVAEKFGFGKDRHIRSEPKQFEVALAMGLTDHISLMHEEVESKPVWNFIALRLMPDLTYWRAKNLETPDLVKNMFYKTFKLGLCLRSISPPGLPEDHRITVDNTVAWIERTKALAPWPRIGAIALQEFNAYECGKGIKREALFREFCKPLGRSLAFRALDLLTDDELREYVRTELQRTEHLIKKRLNLTET